MRAALRGEYGELAPYRFHSALREQVGAWERRTRRLRTSATRLGATRRGRVDVIGLDLSRHPARIRCERTAAQAVLPISPVRVKPLLGCCPNHGQGRVAPALNVRPLATHYNPSSSTHVSYFSTHSLLRDSFCSPSLQCLSVVARRFWTSIISASSQPVLPLPSVSVTTNRPFITPPQPPATPLQPSHCTTLRHGCHLGARSQGDAMGQVQELVHVEQ